jgi:hypothetical protein
VPPTTECVNPQLHSAVHRTRAPVPPDMSALIFGTMVRHIRRGGSHVTACCPGQSLGPP